MFVLIANITTALSELIIRIKLIVFLLSILISVSPLNIHAQNKEKIDMLFDDSYADYESGRYEDAIEKGEKVLSFYKKHGHDYSYILDIISDYYLKYNEPQKALTYKKNSLEALGYLTKEISNTQYYKLEREAQYNFDNNNFLKAIIYMEEAINVYKQIYGQDLKERYNYILLFKAYSAIEYIEKAIYFKNKAKLDDTEISKFASLFPIDKYQEKANEFAEKKDYIDACKYQEKALAYCDIFFRDNSTFRASVLSNLAFYYSLVSATDSLSYKYGKEASNIHEAIGDTLSISYYLAISCITGYYDETKDYDNAIVFGKKRLFITNHIYGEESKEKCDAIKEVYMYYEIGQKYNESILFLDSIKTDIIKTYGHYSPEFLSIIISYCKSYTNMKDYNKAINYSEEALDIINNIYGTESKEYVNFVNLFFVNYLETGDYGNALKLINKSIDISIKLNDPELLIRSYSKLERYYGEKGDYYNGLLIAKKINDKIKDTYGIHSNEYLAQLNNIIISHINRCDYKSGFEISNIALSLVDNVEGLYSHNKYKILSNHALILSHLGYMTEALEFSSRALSYALDSIESPYREQCKINELHNSSKYLYLNGDIKSALNIEKKCTEMLENVSVSNNYKINIYNHIAKLYYTVDSIPYARQYAQKAYNICDSHNNNDVLKAMALMIMADCDCEEGIYDQAINKNKEALNAISHYNDNDIVKIKYCIYANLSYLLSIKTDYKESSFFLAESFKFQKELLISNLINMIEDERTSFTRTNDSNFNYVNYIFKNSDYNTNYASQVYNNSILNKSILLNCNTTLGNIINKYSNKEVKQLYDSLLVCKQKLSNLEYNNYGYNKIATKAHSIENKLLLQIKENDDLSKKLSTNFNDIIKILNDNEIAIEYVSITNDSTNIYVALILRNNFTEPKIVFIGTENDISKYIEISHFQFDNKYFYKLLWGKIVDSTQIQPGENIYFSPDGIINKIPIEYIPTEDGTIMADKYNIHRVSSTRELCFREEEVKPSSAVLYGGLKYNVDDDTLLAQSNKYSNVELSDDYIDNMLRGERGDDLQRAKYNELPYTKIEVDAIEKTLKSKKINVKKFTQAEGNEESFKAMSGKAPSIIHIATHGFYLQPTEAEINSQKTSFEKMTLFSDNKQNFIDYSMNRTGLLMAGAQNAITGKSIPEGVDDGILTAKEISLLDLHGVDLAVLSACQTGLGDMTTDGIAGLQRGFKNAGVKTILMSLWKVDDGATSMLMTQFYKELMNGKSKHDALRSAQKYLREYEQDGERIYADFKYWAAFVLLD